MSKETLTKIANKANTVVRKADRAVFGETYNNINIARDLGEYDRLEDDDADKILVRNKIIRNVERRDDDAVLNVFKGMVIMFASYNVGCLIGVMKKKLKK